MSQIVVTTGIYDLIKDQIRRKKVTPSEEEILTVELKNARQVRRKEIPEDVVDIDTKVTIKDLTDNTEQEIHFTAPEKAKPKHNTTSILSRMGLALVGYKAGDRIKWPFEEQVKEFEILRVERM